MSYNVAAYLLYLSITIFIIVYVGRLLHRNGRLFILALLQNDAVRTDHLNNILLIAYYLFNIGYALLTLRYWENVLGMELLISSLCKHLSVLIFILACTHYLNMLCIAYFLTPKPASFTPKK